METLFAPNRGCHFTAFFGKLPLWRQKSNPSADHEMKKLSLSLVALLASLTISQAEIGETMKEVLAHGVGWKPIQFHDCPALQSASVTSGTTTLIFNPKTNRPSPYSTRETDYQQNTSTHLGIDMVNGKLSKTTPSWPRGISSIPGWEIYGW